MRLDPHGSEEAGPRQQQSRSRSCPVYEFGLIGPAGPGENTEVRQTRLSDYGARPEFYLGKKEQRALRRARAAEVAIGGSEDDALAR